MGHLHEHTTADKGRNARKRARSMQRARAEVDAWSGLPVQGSSPGSLESSGTTATLPNFLGNSASTEWVADFEYVWRTRIRPVVAALAARARVRGRQERAETSPGRRVELARSRQWAQHRVRALSMARLDVVSTCEQRWRSVACECGRVELRVPCDQPLLCRTCARRHWQRHRRRVTLAMDAALREERAAWRRTPSTSRRGMCPGVYLITLTGPHSGDLEVDRERMGRAARSLLKIATRYGWWRVYALTWEVTPGSLGDGHLHAHLAVVSSWVPYDELRIEWARAMPGAIQPDVQAPRSGADGAACAAAYVAKYVTKGVQPGEMSGAKAGEMLIAFRGKRKITTSRNFWVRRHPSCACCGRAYALISAPESLQRIAPGAVLRSRAESVGIGVLRGPPQKSLW